MSSKQKWLAAFAAVAAVAVLVTAGLLAAPLADDEPAPASSPTAVPSPSPTADEPGDPTPTPTPARDDPDDPVSTPAPEPREPRQEPSAQVVEPRPGMSDVRPIGWSDYEVLNERLVRVFFTSGVEPCYVLDRTEVQYQPDRVVVTLFQGREPGSANVACIEIAVSKAVDVALDEPLAGRSIVDGSQQ